MNKKLLAVFSLLTSMTLLAACGGGETSSGDNVNSGSTSTSAPTSTPDEECTAHTGGSATCTEKAVCETCGKEYGELAQHEFTVEQSDETNHWLKCANCEATDGVEAHVAGTEVKYDETNHWNECECGYEMNVEAHVAGTEVKYDETNHWNECECGFEMNEEAHVLVGGKNETHHWGSCECGYADEEIAHEYTLAKSDETHHWTECVCGAATEKVAHDYATGNFDETQHWNECECGAIDEKVEHEPSELWNSTAEEHWHECECGYQVNKGAHVAGDEWQTDAESHWKNCAECGFGLDKIAHDFVGSFVDDVYVLNCECGVQVEVEDTIKYFDRENKNYILADGSVKQNVKEGVNQGNYWDGATNIVTVETQSDVTCGSDSATKVSYNFSLLTEEQLAASDIGWAGWKNNPSMWVGYAIPLNNLNVNNLELVLDMKFSNMNPSFVLYLAADYEGEDESIAYTTGTQFTIEASNAQSLGDGWFRYTILLADTVSVAEEADYIVLSLDNTLAGLDKRAESVAYIDNVTINNIVTYTVTVDGKENTVRKNTNFSVETPEKAGYEFLGWQDTEGNSVEFPLFVTGDVAIVSTWNKLPIPVKANETKVDVDLSTLPEDKDYEEYIFTAPAGTYNVTVTGDVYAVELIDGEMGDEITQFVFTEETTVIFGMTFAAGQTGSISIMKEIPEGLEEQVFLDHLFKGSWDYTDDRRAFVNRMEPSAVITEDVPAGYTKVSRFDWHQNSTQAWQAGGNALYRSYYVQNSIANHVAIRFGIMLETNGDAVIEFANGLKIQNEWIFVHLEQTAPAVWSMSVLNEDGDIIYGVNNIKRYINGLTDVDSIASLAFPTAWDNNVRTQSMLLKPCSSNTMTASVYTTEIIGYAEPYVYDPGFAEGSVEVSSSALNYAWTYGLNTQKHITALPTLLSESAADYDVADGFSKVSKVTSGTGWTSSIIGGGVFSELDVSNYEELWFALKAVNGRITNTQGTWKDITTVGDNSWIYFHLTQTADSVWTIEIIKEGVTVLTLENQIPAAGKATNLSQLMDNSSNETTKGRVNIYHNGAGNPVEIYASELIGLEKS